MLSEYSVNEHSSWKSHQRLLELVGLDASDEEGVALAEGGHQRLEALLELRAERGRALPGLGPHAQVGGEDLLQEAVLGDVDQLQEVGGEGVPVLVEEAARVVEDDAGEVVEAEGGVDVRLGLQVVAVVAVPLVQFVEQCLMERLID